MQNDNPSNSMTTGREHTAAPSPHLMSERRRPSFHIDSSSDEEEDGEVGSPVNEPLTLHTASKLATSPPSSSPRPPFIATANQLPLANAARSGTFPLHNDQARFASTSPTASYMQQQRMPLSSASYQRQPLHKNPHLSGSSHVLASLQQNASPLNAAFPPHVQISSELVERFSSESLHSFSFAFLSQNSISSRLDILKRSLEFLRDNPALTSMSNFPSTSSTTALEDFFKAPAPSRTQLRSSASSAALSMLANYPVMTAAPGASSSFSSRPSFPPVHENSNGTVHGGSAVNLNSMARGATTTSATTAAHSFLGEPTNTLFDDNLKSVLTLLENAHVFPASGSSDSSSPANSSASNSKLYSILNNRSKTKPPTPFKPITSRTLSNPLPSTDVDVILEDEPANPAGPTIDPSATQQGTNGPLLEPLKIRKRTKTNIATFHLQAQLLEALAAPYHDPYWTNLIQRTGAVSSMPTISTSASTVDLKSAGLRNPAMFSSAASILHPTSSRITSNQAVFTTSALEPYLILASNDISCLVFGMSKAEIRRQNIADIVGADFRPALLERARACPLNCTFLCGEIFPIVKCNGQTGLASFFAKKHNSGIIAWVIEEIAHDKANIAINLTDGKFTISGPQQQVLFPFINGPTPDNNLRLHDILSGIPEDLRVLADNLRKDKCHVENHVTISGNTIVPTLIKTDENDKPDDNILLVQLVSIPHMAGAILINPETMAITGYNASLVEQLFGYPAREKKHWVGLSIDELIPHFSTYVSKIEQMCDLDLRGKQNQGLVVPEHLFRKVAVQLQMERSSRQNSLESLSSTPTGPLTNDNSEASTAAGSPVVSDANNSSEDFFAADQLPELPSGRAVHKNNFALGGFMPKKQLDTISAFMDSKGIEAQHKDGIHLTIDVQMRIIGDGSAVLWVTYSRNITGQQESNQLPSQLTLFTMKNASQRRTKKSSSSKSLIDQGGRHSNSSTQSDQSSNASLSSLSEPANSNESLPHFKPTSPTSPQQARIEVPQPTTPSSSNDDTATATSESAGDNDSKPDSQSSGSSTETQVSDGSSSTSAELSTSHLTPRAQITRPIEETPNSASSIYSIHIAELGARRREKTLADFKILKRMGEGAYGKVILAEYAADPPLRIILKSIIKERILVDTWTRDRKLGTIPSEIKVMAVLTKWPHDNIVQLLDFFEDDEYFHIEMEPHGSPGTDLFDLIENQPEMLESQCRNLFKQVVAAVRHLHSHDIVHRDIKDENVIVDGEGLVKLIDFGSSAFVRQGPFDVFVGTLDYAAPEVLAGKPYEGKPQDIWALGILLYTIVYKENPFYNVDEIMDHDLRIPFVMSEDCIDLIKLILTRPVRKRPTVEEIWNHPWLQVEA